MHFLQAGSLTAPYAGAIIGLGCVFGTSSNGATEFMLRPQMWIKQRTAYFGTAEVVKRPSLSSQEIVTWLREEGIPINIKKMIINTIKSRLKKNAISCNSE